MNEVLITVTATVDGQPRPLSVPARLVAPGLAVGPALRNGGIIPGWYALVHVPSGHALGPNAFCGDHIQAAVDIAAGCGVDWRRPLPDLLELDRHENVLMELQYWVSCAQLHADAARPA